MGQMGLHFYPKVRHRVSALHSIRQPQWSQFTLVSLKPWQVSAILGNFCFVFVFWDRVFFFFLIALFIYLFIWYQGSNSRPHICQASTVSLSYIPSQQGLLCIPTGFELTVQPWLASDSLWSSRLCFLECWDYRHGSPHWTYVTKFYRWGSWSPNIVPVFLLS